MVVRVTAMIVFVTLVTACHGGKTSPRRLQQSRESLTSWMQSLQLVERQWQQGRVPRIYVQQMTAAVVEATNKERKALRSPPPDLAELMQQLESQTQRLTDQTHKAGP
jgi:hypothetical protein